MKNLFLLALIAWAVPALATDPVQCDPSLFARLAEVARPQRTLFNRFSTETSELSHLSKKIKFAEIATLSEEIMKHYPPSKYFVVGMGRSPFPFVDYINLARPKSATTIPVSYNEYIGSKPWFPSPSSAPWKRKLEPHSRGKDPAAFRKFMADFLPSESELAGREMVILDFADYGTGINKFSVDLKDFLQSQGRTTAHKLAYVSARRHADQWYLAQLAEEHGLGRQEWWMLGERPALEKKLRNELPGFVNIHLRDELEELGSKLDEEVFKPYSPYGHHTPTAGSKDFKATLPERREHKKFVEALSADFTHALESSPEFRRLIDSHRR